MEDIYKMKLHETLKISDDTWVLRVPGGWIYEVEVNMSAEESHGNTSRIVFVPFNNEFQQKK